MFRCTRGKPSSNDVNPAFLKRLTMKLRLAGSMGTQEAAMLLYPARNNLKYDIYLIVTTLLSTPLPLAISIRELSQPGSAGGFTWTCYSSPSFKSLYIYICVCIYIYIYNTHTYTRSLSHEPSSLVSTNHTTQIGS